jgi:AcrR family transcriptional regulator
MGRRRQPQIRQQLLDSCTDYSLEHGLPGRLAPLATAAGTSSRMLIYHFGTRDGLLREILGQARKRQIEAFSDLLRLRPDEPYPMTPTESRYGPASDEPRPPTGSHLSRKACAAWGNPSWRPLCSP